MKVRSVALFLALLLLSSPLVSFAYQEKTTFPRLANYYLKWELSEGEARELAKWDLLVLDMETQENSPGALRLIRQLNPDIVILAYITSQEIIEDIYATVGNTPSHLRNKLKSQLDPSWWLTSSNGNRIMNWPGTYMLNLSEHSPRNSQGFKFNQFLPHFISENIASKGFFDGVFYDNTWGDVSWVQTDIDIDRDGQRDGANKIDQSWAQGVESMLALSRQLMGQNFIIVGNGRVYWDYQNLLHGMMLESFPSDFEADGTWAGSMSSYHRLDQLNSKPNFSIINVGSRQETNYQAMRFGLVSALLGNGYFSYDYDTTNHTQTWWYDEYEVALGPATSKAYNLLSPDNTNFQAGLWRRDFKYGSVFLNSTNQEQLFLFPKENLEKIKGYQDQIINSGDKISYLKLDPYDAIILLRTSDTIFNDAFNNGYFYRVFNKSGQQAKNGFFAYSPNFASNAQVVIADGSRREAEDVNLLAHQGKVTLHKNGVELASFYPYDHLYRGPVNISTYINNGFIETVAIGPEKGGGPQVRVFSATGDLISSFFASDKNQRGGISVALADLDGDGKLDIVTGAGIGDRPEVKVFSLQGELKYSFLAFPENFRGGVRVAVGNISSPFEKNIIVSPNTGGGPQVRIFSTEGRLLGQFFAYEESLRKDLDLALSDTNNNGLQEILVGIRDPF